MIYFLKNKLELGSFFMGGSVVSVEKIDETFVTIVENIRFVI